MNRSQLEPGCVTPLRLQVSPSSGRRKTTKLLIKVQSISYTNISKVSYWKRRCSEHNTKECHIALLFLSSGMTISSCSQTRMYLKKKLISAIDSVTYVSNQSKLIRESTLSHSLPYSGDLSSRCLLSAEPGQFNLFTSKEGQAEALKTY